ncbi:MAG TPA: phenylalanine--tRNA ligase beta subunit-related protein [Herpetosiphonaceae bacterium]
MVTFTLDADLRQKVPSMMLGLVEAEQLQVQLHDPGLWTMLEELCERLRSEFAGKAAADRAEIAATRRAYRALGDDPTRYRPANEALLRRVLSRRALPQINTVVDVNNYVSLVSGFAIGCYDVAQLGGTVTARAGRDGEQYAPIGKAAVDAANRLVLADEQGIFGSPTADSQRSMVTPATRHVLFVIFGFEASQAALDQAVEQVAELLCRFCAASIRDRRVLSE